MNTIAGKALHKISWAVEDIGWFFKKPFFEPGNQFTPSFCIGITTFMDRFETCLRPLLAKISTLFPECQIIVLANGHVRKKEQTAYIYDIDEYCRKFNNVKLIAFNEPMGLSYLWNTIIRNSDSSSVLILNDDIRIKREFRSFIADSGISNVQIATINRSWSHFMIEKSVVNVVGWFDEHFSEIGGEDDDYLARLAMNGFAPRDFSTHTIARTSKKSRVLQGTNSYGRDMSKEYGGYSTLNTDYLFKKWETSQEYFEGSVMVPGRKIPFWKLREVNGSEDRSGMASDNGELKE